MLVRGYIPIHRKWCTECVGVELRREMGSNDDAIKLKCRDYIAATAASRRVTHDYDLVNSDDDEGGEGKEGKEGGGGEGQVALCHLEAIWGDDFFARTAPIMERRKATQAEAREEAEGLSLEVGDRHIVPVALGRGARQWATMIVPQDDAEKGCVCLQLDEYEDQQTMGYYSSKTKSEWRKILAEENATKAGRVFDIESITPWSWGSLLGPGSENTWKRHGGTVVPNTPTPAENDRLAAKRTEHEALRKRVMASANASGGGGSGGTAAGGTGGGGAGGGGGGEGGGGAGGGAGGQQ